MAKFIHKDGKTVAKFVNVAHCDILNKTVVIYMVQGQLRTRDAEMFLHKFTPFDEASKEAVIEIQETVEINDPEKLLFIHDKTGGIYLVESLGFLEQNTSKTVAYRSTGMGDVEESEDFPFGTLWFRPLGEFKEKFSPLNDTAKKSVEKDFEEIV
jgi:hypothetical protein